MGQCKPGELVGQRSRPQLGEVEGHVHAIPVGLELELAAWHVLVEGDN
jgi:hypothetical protein